MKRLRVIALAMSLVLMTTACSGRPTKTVDGKSMVPVTVNVDGKDVKGMCYLLEIDVDNSNSGEELSENCICVDKITWDSYEISDPCTAK